MITIIIAIIAIRIYTSPLSLTLSTTAISILIRVLALTQRNNCFTPARVILSFSSGIMVIFFYCSILSSHEKKRKNWITAVATALIISITVKTEKVIEQGVPDNPSFLLQTNFLILGIRAVLVSILCINIRILFPKKAFIHSY